MFRQISKRFFGSTSARVINFNAGPAALPESVLKEAQRDLVNWKGCGMGVMEMSHRSKEYDSIHNKAIHDLTELLKIPKNYKVLFVQGGASTQFASVPLNLIKSGTADYLVTGSWSKGAYTEAQRYGKVNLVSSSLKNVEDQSKWNLTPGASYLAYCDNETVGGVEMPFIPEVDCPIVADMSSNFISKPVDVSKFGVIFAGAQKNVGPSGVTIVIVREDLLGNALDQCPKMLNWETMASKNSLYNTPPCFSIYMAGLTFAHTLELGGIEAMHEINKEKADLLYNMIENSEFYSSPVDPNCRSKMNVPFRVGLKGGDESIEAIFLKESSAKGMQGLKGHRSVGGIRASIYNSVPKEHVEALVKFMEEFELKHK